MIAIWHKYRRTVEERARYVSMLRQSAEGRQHDTLRQSAEGRQHDNHVNLKVYDILGKEINPHVNEEKEREDTPLILMRALSLPGCIYTK